MQITRLLVSVLAFASASAADLTPSEARTIAKEAYIYAYPMVDGYRINYAFYLLPGNPEYKGPQNELISVPRLFSPKDTAVQTPNSDTPYSFFGVDLRTEPFVVLQNNYLYRMTAAILGIYGNSKAEAMYPMYSVDAAGEKLDATQHRYTLRFAPGQLPPVHAFWSVTMYDLPAQLLVDNAINRYLINSPMLPNLKRDDDGGLTLHIQHQPPGKELEANWLPAPKGPYFMAMRLYWPKDDALNGQWTAPKVQKLD